MIRNFLEAQLVDCANIHDGLGMLKHKTIFDEQDFKIGFKFMNYTILPPHTTIGIHQHGNDVEIYVILEGEGVMSLEGEKYPVKTGDIIVNKPFGTHGLENLSNEELKVLVMGSR